MANSPAYVRSQLVDLFGSGALPVLEEIFRTQYSLHPERYKMLLQQRSTDRDIWQSSELHDMPLHSQVAEGSEYSYQKPLPGANKTFVMQKHGLGFSISEEMVDDGKFDFIADALRKMADSAAESKEIQAMNIFNNAFGSQTTADGVSLCNTAHTLPGGATFRNKPATDVDLSVSALDDMLNDFRTQFVGDTGIIKRIEPKVLLVHTSQERYAKELIGSDLKPDSADNNLNSLKGEGLVVVSSPHLTDTDAWFMLATPSDTGLMAIMRKDVETKAKDDFDTDSIRYKSRYRWQVGTTHAYGSFGTSGG